MMMNSGSLDYWRNYFRDGRPDIFDIIEGAIMVAASDHPKDFRSRRGEIAERLFSCKNTRCLACDRDELAVSVDNEDGGDCNCNCKSDFDGGDGAGAGAGAEIEFQAAASKESKVNSSYGDNNHGDMNMMKHVSNYSYEEAEALTDVIEEQSQSVKEMLRIKDILLNRDEESDSVLIKSLRRLQLMDLTVDLLKATEIGKAVNSLRKHRSKDICQLARTLIKDWKKVVDEWVKAATPIAGSEGTPSEGTPDSANPSVVDDEEEGLPSPPMDEGAFFATQAGPMELSRFFDGMDDDGNPQQHGEIVKNQEESRRPCLNNQNITKRKYESPNEANIVGKDSTSQQEKKNEAAMRQNKSVTVDSGLGRPPKSTMQKKGDIEPTLQQNILKDAIPKRPQVGQPDKFKCSDDAAVQVKLEATKRKLRERYQQAENAKRQRTIQVMELHELPKQGFGHRNPLVKPGNHKRQLAHGRR